jgi:hypothetical protein
VMPTTATPTRTAARIASSRMLIGPTLITLTIEHPSGRR